MRTMLERWRHWYGESRANGHSRWWSARWAARVAWGVAPHVFDHDHHLVTRWDHATDKVRW
jgi:hypothetical protein